MKLEHALIDAISTFSLTKTKKQKMLKKIRMQCNVRVAKRRKGMSLMGVEKKNPHEYCFTFRKRAIYNIQ